MSTKTNGFGIDENDLRSQLLHWFRFDHLRPEQGIALLIGLVPNGANLKAVTDWCKNSKDDNAILRFGIPLLTGDAIQVPANPLFDNKKIHRQFSHSLEDTPCINDGNESVYEMSQDELYLLSASYEAEARAFAVYQAELEEEWLKNLPGDLEFTQYQFNDLFQQHRRLLQYWNSGTHQPALTPLPYFVNWAKSKGFTPPWRQVAAESGLIPEETFLDQRTHENQSCTNLERERLLKQIGALALTLAEKSKKYKCGDNANASQIAESMGIILKDLPDANICGVGNSSIRASIKVGIDLLTTIGK